MTIIERLTGSIGLSDERARQHLKGGYVRVDGEVVRDPGHETADGARIVLQPEGVTEQT
ncbi:hypothetical protein [Pseudonocardia sediminis]|uniref:hypothetical protein n=1 Tax=Pseudonocardia sediminis TaxID=1397368 RepID=UPI0013EF5A04|nr:hypothetical protein [Pseudonocardia sediminis]